MFWLFSTLIWLRWRFCYSRLLSWLNLLLFWAEGSVPWRGERSDLADDFTLRVAVPEDGPRVTALLEACYPLLMAGGYEEADLAVALPLMTRANPALLSSGTYYVAEAADGQVVGCGGWTRERPGTAEVADGLAHIRHFGTRPDWLGRGVGRAIYKLCEKEARAAGVQRLECYSSLNAERFYLALGFTKSGPMVIPLDTGVGLPAVLMVRAI